MDIVQITEMTKLRLVLAQRSSRLLCQIPGFWFQHCWTKRKRAEGSWSPWGPLPLCRSQPELGHMPPALQQGLLGATCSVLGRFYRVRVPPQPPASSPHSSQHNSQDKLTFLGLSSKLLTKAQTQWYSPRHGVCSAWLLGLRDQLSPGAPGASWLVIVPTWEAYRTCSLSDLWMEYGYQKSYQHYHQASAGLHWMRVSFRL